MKRLLLIVFLVSFVFLQATIVGYFISWGVYGRDYHVMDIPAEQITHINYAFANIDGSSLEIVLGDPYADIDKFYPGDSWEPGSLRGSFHQLQLLKEQYPHIKTLISVGGWTWSANFSLVAATEESRQNFAASCVEFIQEYEFDGVDIDWEYPVSGGLAGNHNSPDDTENFVLLLEELRTQLDDAGDYLLTAALPAGPDKIENHDLAGMEPYLDFVNLMSYDFHGPWGGDGDAVTGHLAALYPQEDDPLPEPYNSSFNASVAVNTYLESIPAQKMNLGFPFYGRGFAGVTNANNGLYQTWTNCPWFGTWENGSFEFDDIKDNYENMNGYTRYWDEEAIAPWLYNSDAEVMITYEDTLSARLKAEYIVANNLGGAMIWELSCDREELLLGEIYEALNSDPPFYGDIDENMEVDSYDAALLLQYIVGYDPLPELDPIPWEDERIERADTDGDDTITAYDAALILRFAVGIINQFPAE